jgi:hypothetical protein
MRRGGEEGRCEGGGCYLRLEDGESVVPAVGEVGKGLVVCVPHGTRRVALAQHRVDVAAHGGSEREHRTHLPRVVRVGSNGGGEGERARAPRAA